MVNMSSNLADLPLDLLADLPPVLISHGQDEFKFGRSTPRSAGRSTPLVVKNGNFTLLLRSSGQEWQFHTATDI